MDLKEVGILGDGIDEHWYYQSKAKATIAMLDGISPLNVLDVGAGSGFFSRYILDHTTASNALCVDPGYESDSDQTRGDKQIKFRREISSVEADLILLMDVLEHVDSDVSLLRTYVDKAPSGSKFLISVPAFQFLWSPHDVFLEHKRRYRLGHIESVAQDAGLTVIRGNYFFTLIFPLAAVLRLASRALRRNAAPRSQLTRQSESVNRFLNLVLRLEIPIMRRNRLFGLTAFCLAEKR